MKKIGLTQRVSTEFHGQAHDCLDANWSKLLMELNLCAVPLSNIGGDDAVIFTYLNHLEPEGLILTGGNDLDGLGDVSGSQPAPERDHFEITAIKWALGHKVPVLGICRGMQLLNIAFGGDLKRVSDHVAVDHPLQRSPHPLPDYFQNMAPTFTVNSFHSWGLGPKEIGQDLQPVAFDQTGFIEAFFHTSEKIAGIMWHPERPSPVADFDRAFLRHFF